MFRHPLVLAVGVAFIATALFDIWRTLRRASGTLRLLVVLFHAFLWCLFIASGVAAIDYAVDSHALTYSDRLLRAAFAFAGLASVPGGPPETFLLGLTRLAGRIHLVVTGFLIAAVLLQQGDVRRSTPETEDRSG